MPPAVCNTRPNITYSADQFEISVFVDQKNTYIFCKFTTSGYTTSEYPLTFEILSKEVPGVLNTICHNDLHLPFCEEVKNTELAHLFEHILIQEMAEIRDRSGEYKDYSGETYWNWLEDEKGVFHVTLSSTSEDLDILETACNRSVEVLDKILCSKAKQTSQTRLPAQMHAN